jgi:hypothetical protein
MPDGLERRQFRRFPLQLPLLHKFKAPAPVRSGVGWTHNLSEGGACVELGERLMPQTPFWLRLQTDGGPIEIEAEVAWAGEPDATGGSVLHGVLFTQVAPDQLHPLHDLILFKGHMRHPKVRLPFDFPVTCQRKGLAAPAFQGRTRDISRGGVLLRLPQILPPDTALEFTLHTPIGPLTLEGTVIWVAPPEGRTPGGPIRHGLQFTALGGSKSLSLALLLAGPV